MIGNTISHYKILEKLGEARPNLPDCVVQAGDFLTNIEEWYEDW